MPDIISEIVTARQVAEFYKQYPGFWFLLEVLKTSNDGKAELMRVARYDQNKEVLREYLMEEQTDINGKYIFVFAHPDGKCEL